MANLEITIGDNPPLQIEIPKTLVLQGGGGGAPAAGSVDVLQLAAAVLARILPTLPDAGSRDNKIPKFDGDALGWEEDAGAAGAESFSELTGKIAAAQITDGSIPGGKLTANSVTASQLAPNSVATAEIKDANVTVAKLAAAVTALLLPAFPDAGSRDNKVPKFDGNTLGWEVDASAADGAESFSDLTGNIAASQIANGSIPAGKLTAGTISSTQLSAAIIALLLPAFPTSGSRNDKVLKFSNNALGWEADSTAANSVGTTELKNAAVTSAKLATTVTSLLLPTFPNSGSRNDKVLKFSSNTLGWETDAQGVGGSGTTVLAGTREPKSSDGADGNFWIAGLENGTVLSISENVTGAWVELARASYDKEIIANLQHVTRDLHAITDTPEWTDAANADGDVYYQLYTADRSLSLLDLDFDGLGASDSIPKNNSGETRPNIVIVRLPIAVNHTERRISVEGIGDLTGNVWTALSDTGTITVPVSTTYQYWLVGQFSAESNAIDLQIQKRGAVAHSEFEGKLAGAALAQIPTIPGQPGTPSQDTKFNLLLETDGSASWKRDVKEDDIADLQHLTRDLHTIDPIPEWSTADDSEVDIYATVGNVSTINDSVFDNQGATYEVPSNTTGNLLAVNIFARFPIAADISIYRMRDGLDGSTVSSNHWIKTDTDAITGSDTDTYQYWTTGAYIDSEPGAVEVKIEKRKILASTEFGGKLIGEALKQLSSAGGGGSNVPDKPSTPSTDTEYNLEVKSDGTATWKEDTGGGDSDTVFNNAAEIETLQHLTRDLHAIVDVADWENAADSDGDIYYHTEATPSEGTDLTDITLSDTDFDNEGATSTIPSNTTGDDRTVQIFVRLPADEEHTLYRLSILELGFFSGNQWIKPGRISNVADIADTATYQYWYATGSVDSQTGDIHIILQKRAEIEHTEFEGRLAGAALEQIPDLPDKPSTPTNTKEYNLALKTDGTAAWKEDTTDLPALPAIDARDDKILIFNDNTLRWEDFPEVSGGSGGGGSLEVIGSYILPSSIRADRWVDTGIVIPDDIDDGDIYYLEASPQLFEGLYAFRAALLRDHTTLAVANANVNVDLSPSPASVAVLSDLRGGQALGIGKTASGTIAFAFEFNSGGKVGTSVTIYKLAGGGGTSTSTSVNTSASLEQIGEDYTVPSNAVRQAWLDTGITLPDDILDTDLYGLETYPFVFGGILQFRAALLRDETTPAVPGNITDADGSVQGARAVKIDFKNAAGYVLGVTSTKTLAIAFEANPSEWRGSPVRLYKFVGTGQLIDSKPVPFLKELASVGVLNLSADTVADTGIVMPDILEDDEVWALRVGNEGYDDIKFFHPDLITDGTGTAVGASIDPDTNAANGVGARFRAKRSGANRLDVILLAKDTNGSNHILISVTHGLLDPSLTIYRVDTGGTKSSAVSETIQGHSALPPVDSYNANQILISRGLWYRLLVTDEDVANLYEGVVGRDIFRRTNGELWRGIANNQTPNGFSTDGEWRANPDNAISFILADNDRHIRVGIRKAVYDAAKGSAFATTDKIGIKVTFPTSTNVDEGVLGYYSAYDHFDGEFTIPYVIFQGRHADTNFSLYTETAGDSFTAEFFTVDGDGNATTTHFLTHETAVKHWVSWDSHRDPSAEAQTALELATANQSRLDALDLNVGGVDPLKSFFWDDTDITFSHTAWTHRISGLQNTDLVVFKWKDFHHYSGLAEHVLPGSNDTEGVMYFQVSVLQSNIYLGQLGKFANVNRIVSTGVADPEFSLAVLSMDHVGDHIDIMLSIDVVAPDNNVTMKPAPGMEMSIDIYRNADASNVVNTVHSTLQHLQDEINDLKNNAFRKGTKLASFTPAGTGTNNEHFTVVDTTNVTALNNTGGSGWSHQINMPVRHFSSRCWGIIAELTRGDALITKVFVPWSNFWSQRNIYTGYWSDTATGDGPEIEGEVHTDHDNFKFRIKSTAADAGGTLTIYEAL